MRRHFALIAIGVTVLNAFIASRRARRWFAADVQTQAEAQRFVWRAAAWLALFFVALEALTIASGFDSPFCFLPTRATSGYRGYIGWGIWVAWVGIVTSWVVVGQGAERIARYGPLFSRGVKPGHVYDPRIVRLFVVMWCLSTLAIPLVMPASNAALRGCGTL